MLSLTGSLASASASDLSAAKVAVNEANAQGGVNGHPLTIDTVDDQGTATANLGGMHTLAGDGVHFLVSGQLSPLCDADEKILQSLGILFMDANCAESAETGPNVSPLFFRTGLNTSYILGGNVQTICHQFTGLTRFDYLNANYSLTNNLEQVFKDGVASCGLKVGTDVEVPLTATDMLSYMTALGNGLPSDSKTSDVLVLGIFGAALPNAIKVGASTGIFAKYKYIYYPGTDDSAMMLLQKSLGSSMPLIHVMNDYSYSQPGSVNQQFVTDYQALAGSEPTATAAETYRSMVALIAGLKKSNSTEPAMVAQTIAGLTFQDFAGPETIDATTHQGAVPMILHTYGPSGVSDIATYPSTETLGSLTPSVVAEIAKLGL